MSTPRSEFSARGAAPRLTEAPNLRSHRPSVSAPILGARVTVQQVGNRSRVCLAPVIIPCTALVTLPSHAAAAKRAGAEREQYTIAPIPRTQNGGKYVYRAPGVHSAFRVQSFSIRDTALCRAAPPELALPSPNCPRTQIGGKQVRPSSDKSTSFSMQRLSSERRHNTSVASPFRSSVPFAHPNWVRG
jgi:hypothetical protein